MPPSYAGANRIRFRGLQGGPESPAIPQSQRHLRAAPRETIPVRIGQRGRPGKGLSSLPETRKQPRLGHCERILDSDPAISGETVRMRQRDLIAWPVSVAAAWLAAVMLLSRDPIGILRPCPLRLLTGLPCPTCGGTASMRAFLQGDFARAFATNPLVALLAAASLVTGLAAIVLIPWAGRLRCPGGLRGRGIALILLALLLANWVYLLLRA